MISRRIYRMRLLWGLWAAGILLATSWPDPARFLPPAALSWDKLLHSVIYVPFGLLMALSLRPAAPRWAWALGLAFPVLDELHQLPIPGRFCSVADMAANAAGMLLGLLAARLALLRKERDVGG